MNEIKTFSSMDFGTVRIVMIDNEPWFVGKDVAEILGYTNPLKAIRDHVEDEDKGSVHPWWYARGDCHK